MKITIIVEPVGKGRARTVIRGDKVHSFTPGNTVHAENLIRDRVMQLRSYFEKGVPIKVIATFYRLKPASIGKKVMLPATRPDIDNYFKLLTDSMEKFVYPNDSQITTAIIEKRFGSPPRIELEMVEDTLEGD